MKRLNRKEIISELEQLRQGFSSAKLGSKDKAFLHSIDAYHCFADYLVFKYGGNPIRDDNKHLLEGE